jgi:hypothetical protein
MAAADNIIIGGANKLVVKSVDKTAETIGAILWTGEQNLGIDVARRDDTGWDLTVDQEDASDAFRTLTNDYVDAAASETSNERKYEDGTKMGGTVIADVTLVFAECYGGVLGSGLKRLVWAGFCYIDPTSGSYSQAADEVVKPSLILHSTPAPFAAVAGGAGTPATTLNATMVNATAAITLAESSLGRAENLAVPA